MARMITCYWSAAPVTAAGSPGLHPRLGERELIEALKNLVRAIRDRNPHRLPAGDYLEQTPDAKLKAQHAR